MKLLLMYKERKRPVTIPDEGDVLENLRSAFSDSFSSTAKVIFSIFSEEWGEFIDIDSAEDIKPGSKVMVSNASEIQSDGIQCI